MRATVTAQFIRIGDQVVIDGDTVDVTDIGVGIHNVVIVGRDYANRSRCLSTKVGAKVVTVDSELETEMFCAALLAS